MLYTTFELAKERKACLKSYWKMARYKGGITIWGKDSPIPLVEVLEVCGLHDTLWVMANCCTEPDAAKLASQIFACDCAEHVVHIYETYVLSDNRPRHAINVARQYIAHKATQEELSDARIDARAAAWLAARNDVRADARAAVCAAIWAAGGDIASVARAARSAAIGAAEAADRAIAAVNAISATDITVRATASTASEAGAAEDIEQYWQRDRLKELLCSLHYDSD